MTENLQRETSKRRYPLIVLFLSILSLFLFIANWVIYDAIANIFAITSSSQLLLLAVVLTFMSGGFIVASVLGSYHYNILTRIYYSITAVWMGFFTYLFLSSILYGLLVILFGTTINLVGEILIIGALVTGIFGVFHAKQIKVAEVDVSLENLPEKWRRRRAIWISDLHLGQIHGSSFAKRVVERINTLPHDIIFIGGDLYDGTTAPDADELISPLASLSAPLGTYFITGNHEEFSDNTKFLNAVRRIRIHTLIDESVEIDGLQLIGVDYHNTSNRERFRDILSSFNVQKDKPSILLKHEPKDLTVASDVGISLQISGHTHQAQLWPLKYLARWIYKDFVYGLNRFEKMLVYTSSGTGTWGPPLRVGTNSEIVLLTFHTT